MRRLTPVTLCESPASSAESAEKAGKTRQRKEDKKAKIRQIYLLDESDGGLFVGACSVSLLGSRMQKMQGQQRCFCLRLHSIICLYAHVDVGMLMEITNINTGLNTQ